MKEALKEKKQILDNLISGYGKVAVAFSSGVDSTLLLACAVNNLGKDNVIAITARSGAFPVRETSEAIDFCAKLGVMHEVVDTNELEVDGYADNPPNRCYLCKKEIFSQIKKIANENGIEHIIEGSNMDDSSDYRPGMKAVEEMGILSPFRDAKMTKGDVRELSKELGLITWKKQSFACLASRFAYGEKITREKLKMVDESEQCLLDMGFEIFRVRIHGEKNFIARIEVRESDFSRMIEDCVRAEICGLFREIGFSYVAIDLEGYRTGSMNEVLDI